MQRLQDSGNISIYTVPSHDPSLAAYDNKFKVRAIFEVIPGQDLVFIYGKNCEIRLIFKILCFRLSSK